LPKISPKKTQSRVLEARAVLCYNNGMGTQDFYLTEIQKRIGEAAVKAGRDPREIRLVAASKTRTIDALRALDALNGVAAFGENRVQEFLDKYDPALNWHFIGQLQTNKVKYLIGKIELIHSVDRESLAAEIDRQAKKNGTIQQILIEINSGAEESKGGLMLADAPAFATALQAYPNLLLKGVMAVAPLDIEKEKLASLFLKVRDFYEMLKLDRPCVDTLSMGMSHDFETAIACGSNLVRIGRALFERLS